MSTTVSNAVPSQPAKPSPFVAGLSRVVVALASLKITVTMFGLSIFLIFAGTLAQVDLGIWAVMEQYFRTVVAWIDPSIFVPGTWTTDLRIPYPGGWTLGTIILVNLTAAHLTRFHLTLKRSGMVMIHTGLMVLVLSEFVTGLMADEGQMTIWEGFGSNYVEDIRVSELAVIDTTAADHDRVVAIPQGMLDPGDTLALDELPFTITVEEFHENAALIAISKTERDNPATHGDGRIMVAESRAVQAGTDAGGSVDVPAAYVTLHNKTTGQKMGTYLVSVILAVNDQPQLLAFEGRAYQLFLRFEREYKPYALHLIDFRHDKYLGTETPKNFSSHLRLVDRSRGEDREVVIRMNQPLRYAGETFYQSAFKKGDQGTVLQVVRNPGWLMPYVACVLVTLGLTVQFLMSFSRFSARRAKS